MFAEDLSGKYAFRININEVFCARRLSYNKQSYKYDGKNLQIDLIDKS